VSEFYQTDLRVLMQLLVSLVLTAILGWERESTGKAAGLRTHMLVGMSATLFVSLGEILMLRFQTFGDTVRFDPLRIMEAVIAGISFLGAGTIFVTRNQNNVRGLTTAASILATAAIGCAVGLERYLLAGGATALVFLVLRLLQGIERD
jgi:putative Mg2+ transporter-C (MgtC) family protein